MGTFKMRRETSIVDVDVVVGAEYSSVHCEQRYNAITNTKAKNAAVDAIKKSVDEICVRIITSRTEKS